MKRKVILYRGEDGYVVAEVPSLQGVISQGKTREEVLRNIKEAISLHIEVLMERGLPIPQDETEMVEIAAGANFRLFQAKMYKHFRAIWFRRLSSTRKPRYACSGKSA